MSLHSRASWSDIPSIDAALGEWRQILPSDRVLTGDALQPYLLNCLSLNRTVLAALQPADEDTVCAIVRIAARHQIRVYSFSTGHNWGYGTALPVQDDCVLIDLSRMNRIIEMDRELGLITLQPGVTQGQLSQYLNDQGLDYFVPTTGAGPSASLLGNALERGFGITPEEDHFAAVRQLRAVLPDGSIYQSSLAALGMPTAQCSWKWGVGPYLDGIFAQGNFGIVTAMTIALTRRPEHIEVYVFTLKAGASFPDVVCQCREALMGMHGIAGGIKFMNRAQLSLTLDTKELGMGLSPKFDWVAFGVLHCRRNMLKAVRASLKQLLQPHLSQIIFLNGDTIRRFKKMARLVPGDMKKKLLRQVQQGQDILQIVRGEPRALELRLVYQHVPVPPDGPKDPVKDGVGVIWYAPILPLKKDIITRMISTIQSALRTHGFPEAISMTTVNERCAMGVIPIIYRRPEDKEAAHRCYELLLSEGRKAGCFPYRLPVHVMESLADEAPGFWDLAQTLKSAIDPNHLFSPGRYGS